MKISVSNIAWDNKSSPYYLKYIRELGCSGVEIAPSVVWPEPRKLTKHKQQSTFSGLEHLVITNDSLFVN